MLRIAAELSEDYELCIGFDGQSNAGPWGTKAQGFAEAPELAMDEVGKDLVNVVIPDLPGRAISTTIETLSIGTTLTTLEWNGAYLRLGSKTDLDKGYAKVVKHTTNTITVQWIHLPTNNYTAADAYLIREDFRFASYPNVRILTPWQRHSDDPDARDLPYPTPGAAFASDGQSLVLPAPYTVPATVTSFEDLGLLLPFTFEEGIEGFGISEVSDSTSSPLAHGITNIAAGVWTFANGISDDDLLNEGKLIVDWEDGGVTKRSWATIEDSTTTTFKPKASSWLGDVTTNLDASSKVKRYTLWVPHWQDNPYAWLPGEGFTYPSNDMLPYGRSVQAEFQAAGPQVKNRPRGVTKDAYGDRFGMLLNWVWRLSGALGKRINVVYLNVNSAGLVAAKSWNYHGFPGKVGWWDYRVGLDWGPWVQNGPAARLKKLITTILPNALLAEGNTKQPRFLLWGRAQGEADAINRGGREFYDRSLASWISWVRQVVDDAGYNPYAEGAQLPFVQLLITHTPWELSGFYAPYSVTLDGDADGLVNNAIKEVLTADGFGAFYDPGDDYATLKLTFDYGHFNGKGEAINGEQFARLGGELIERALGYGVGSTSTGLLTHTDRKVAIANLALSHLGETAQIQSWEEDSQQAILCRRFWPEARDNLLSMRAWSFALRRVSLVEVQGPPPQYAYAYVLPADCLAALAVIQPNAPDDYAVGTWPADTIQLAIAQTVPPQQPVNFTIEQSPSGGHRILLTDLEDATLRYVAKVVDASRYPSLFAQALSLHLASMLAGALIKGDVGEAVSLRLLQKMQAYLGQAATQDADQRQMRLENLPPWIANR